MNKFLQTGVHSVLIAALWSTFCAAEPIPYTYDKVWDDGRAEVSTYALTFPRYGEIRSGTAVVVTVKEPYSFTDLVKADRPGSSVGDAMKLLVRKSFPTGIYSYQLGTTAFAALSGYGEYQPGSIVAASQNSQEWCGLTHSQLTRRDGRWRFAVESYFQGESGALDLEPANAIPEEGIFLLARRIVAPAGKSEQRELPLLSSLEQSRLVHRRPRVYRSKVTTSAKVEQVSVKGGTFMVHRFEANEIATTPGAEPHGWSILVEEASPHRIVSWSTTWGEKGELLGSERLKYWELQSGKSREGLRTLGLDPDAPVQP